MMLNYLHSLFLIFITLKEQKRYINFPFKKQQINHIFKSIITKAVNVIVQH